MISVAWQEISCGKHRAGNRVDIHLQGPVMQIFDGDELLKTVLRNDGKEVRKKHAAVSHGAPAAVGSDVVSC